jgi:hypothetical protein
VFTGSCRLSWFGAGVNQNKGSLFVLQMVFGVRHSVLSLFLKFAMRLLFMILKEDDLARIPIPSDGEIRDELMKNAFYNGWPHNHFVG